MPSYTIRVVLHDNATWAQYGDLQERLASIGVVDYICSDEGRWYRLPPAEYTCSTQLEPEVMREAVVNIARAVQPRVAVLVTEATGFYWQGLEHIAMP